MKFPTLTIYLITLTLFLGAPNIDAQSATVSLTSGGSPFVYGHAMSAPLSTQSSVGTPISARLNFGDVGPGGSNRLVRITLPIRVSAMTSYKIEFQRFSIGDSSVTPSDIGFSVGNVRPQTGANPRLTADATHIQIFGNFGIDAVSAPIIGGVPQFPATLASISESPTLILTGRPTVASGSLGDNDSSILVDLVFVVAPQYFTPGAPSVLNLTMTITPTTP